jgi:hypothetical protein
MVEHLGAQPVKRRRRRLRQLLGHVDAQLVAKAWQVQVVATGNQLALSIRIPPGSCERWVDLEDDLTVSILQARLIERDLPIKLVVGSMI